MGYDIYSANPDAKIAEAHARKYARTGGFFDTVDENGNYIGGESVYFRLNIWGMSTLRQIMYGLGVTDETLYDALADNSGNLIDTDLCLATAGFLEAIPDEKVRQVAGNVYREAAAYYAAAGLRQDPKPPTDADVAEQADAWLGTVREWQEFLKVCAPLGGAVVL